MLPRVLPKVQSFSIRVDSSLGEDSAVPADVAESLASEAMSIAAEDGSTATDVCLRMLPQCQEAAAKQYPAQVCLAQSLPRRMPKDSDVWCCSWTPYQRLFSHGLEQLQQWVGPAEQHLTAVCSLSVC